MTALALDIGGTKVAAALVDADASVRRWRSAPTGTDPWPVVAGLAVEVARDTVLAGVGVGCGGPMRWPEGVVSPLNIARWRDGFPLRERLRDLFPAVPIRVHNDAACVAVGEHWAGAGRGCRDLLGMVVSTGVGGGVVLADRLVDGATGNAGHIGHLQVETGGPRCACGGTGCLEAVASGPAIVAWARARGLPAGDGREVAELAATGHPLATEALGRAGAATGRAIASAAALLDVSVVAVGGGVSQAGDPFWRPLLDAVRDQAGLGFLRGLQVVPAQCGQQAGLVGAAALVLRADQYWSPPH